MLEVDSNPRIQSLTLPYSTSKDPNNPNINYGGVNGTSIAAPHVSGGAALLMSRNNTLRFWPEAIKAILMATATNNKDGLPSFPLYGNISDTKDGAGGINLDAADQVASDTNKWTVATVDPSMFDEIGDLPFYFWANAGQTVRAVIAWDTSTSYSYYDSQPAVDLDLMIDAPSRKGIKYSSTFDNTFEIVQFTAPETGNYRLKVHNYRFDIPSTFLGVAWYDF